MITNGTEETFGAVKTENKNDQGLNSRKRPECGFCGYHHASCQSLAYGQNCRKWGQKNYFKLKCRSTTPQVNTVEEVIEEFFRISNVGCGSLAMITTEFWQGKQSKSGDIPTGQRCRMQPPLAEELPTSHWGREFETGRSLHTNLSKLIQKNGTGLWGRQNYHMTPWK